jgi:hypothetical protein
MPEATETTTEAENAEGEGDQQQEQKFTQADIDKLVVKVRGEERRKASEKYADYDDLKTKAEGARTLEERLADVEGELSATKVDAMRSRVAAKFGINTEAGEDGKSDVDLFLTGTDEATITAQAERLAARTADRKKSGNVAPKEGTSAVTSYSPKESAKREWLRSVTGD